MARFPRSGMRPPEKRRGKTKGEPAPLPQHRHQSPERSPSRKIGHARFRHSSSGIGRVNQRSKNNPGRACRPDVGGTMRRGGPAPRAREHSPRPSTAIDQPIDRLGTNLTSSRILGSPKSRKPRRVSPAQPCCAGRRVVSRVRGRAFRRAIPRDRLAERGCRMSPMRISWAVARRKARPGLESQEDAAALRCPGLFTCNHYPSISSR